MVEETHHLVVDGCDVVARYSARARRIQLRVDGRSHEVKLIIPQGMALSKAVRFAEEKSNWIKAQLARVPQHTFFTDGMMLPFLGQEHRVVHRPKGRLVRVIGDEIQVPGNEDHFERRLLDWLKRQANDDIGVRALDKAQRIGKKINRITIRDTVSRWGSCSSKANLSFNWRLILTPDEVRDYLAAHEVAHLQEMNHSARFWALCEELTDMTSVKQSERYLKDNARRLFSFGPTK